MPLVQISRKNKKKKGMESQRQAERETNIWPWPMEFMTGGWWNFNIVKEIIYPKDAQIDIREFDWKKEEEI
jgi:hypothetical protein